MLGREALAEVGHEARGRDSVSQAYGGPRLAADGHGHHCVVDPSLRRVLGVLRVGLLVKVSHDHAHCGVGVARERPRDDGAAWVKADGLGKGDVPHAPRCAVVEGPHHHLSRLFGGGSEAGAVHRAPQREVGHLHLAIDQDLKVVVAELGHVAAAGSCRGRGGCGGSGLVRAAPVGDGPIEAGGRRGRRHDGLESERVQVQPGEGRKASHDEARGAQAGVHDWEEVPARCSAAPREGRAGGDHRVIVALPGERPVVASGAA
mmetsp:Transcript_5703/g.24115  ORF Transcript_5703/g.24115 Transcript_5703/m.24115 type:complete len:261 (-) Transcript_5703:951-1733(-)